MSQTTDLKQTTPTSTKRKIAEPNTPKKKKTRRNFTENPQMMFNDWLNQFREMNSKYTNVDLSLHASQRGKPNNFLVLSQKPIKSGSKPNDVSMHFNIIPTMLKQMHKLYMDLCVENGIIKPNEEDKLIVDEWISMHHNQSFERYWQNFMQSQWLQDTPVSYTHLTLPTILLV